ncbi:unnamed protein product [Orchesella dallaii]|uniref:FHA domain-containing protein n=1 Tax=Orchesella dallaii TaxID=48710 RepID=A0ABP1R9D2_9HEXA
MQKLKVNLQQCPALRLPSSAISRRDCSCMSTRDHLSSRHHCILQFTSLATCDLSLQFIIYHDENLYIKYVLPNTLPLSVVFGFIGTRHSIELEILEFASYLQVILQVAPLLSFFSKSMYYNVQEEWRNIRD